ASSGVRGASATGIARTRRESGTTRYQGDRAAAREMFDGRSARDSDDAAASPDGILSATSGEPRDSGGAVSRAKTEYRYARRTGRGINGAGARGRVCAVRWGAADHPGPHLPLDVDLVCPVGIATGAGKEIADKLLVLPVVAYGYTGHVMDFPGTINTDFEHFMHQVLDITKSLAYHGFKKIILLNGHGSKLPNLDPLARRAHPETTRGERA